MTYEEVYVGMFFVYLWWAVMLMVLISKGVEANVKELVIIAALGSVVIFGTGVWAQRMSEDRVKETSSSFNRYLKRGY